MSASGAQGATPQQARAADPARSVWVEASAGSGKTRVLIDRVLRLLLAGTPPERILCLTFTRAAAAQMQTRLGSRLGGWAVCTEDELRQELTYLTGAPPRAEAVDAARTLFARVAEQPGGMRISTLHAFAQSLLGAFPLEARLAPGFSVVEEGDARAWLDAAREAAVATAPAAVMRTVARLVPPRAFAGMSAPLASARTRLEGAVLRRQGEAALLRALAGTLGLDPAAPDERTILLEAAQPREEEALLAAARAMEAEGGKTNAERGAAMREWLALPPELRADRWSDWRSIFLTDKNAMREKPVAKGKLQTARHDALLALLLEEAKAVLRHDERVSAARVHGATAALLALGLPLLQGYAAYKNAAAALDYDDLITLAARLLHDPGSAWVLFKLDGGIDHVLLDEAQDTNPAQWAVLAALTGEFFAGEGARGSLPRTVFAVGDPKQSIFRFQGADPAGFSRAREHYQALATGADAPFEAVRLATSFRSAAPVLALVDATFRAGTPAAAGVDAAGTRHVAHRAGHAGAVELWPLLEDDASPPVPPWQPPTEPVEHSKASHRLAAAMAERIHAMVERERLPARRDPAGHPDGRPIRPGDILVLVRSRERGDFGAALTRALKGLQVPVSGLDRLTLSEHLAVRDALALAEFALLPEDDLTLAALLKSPLVGLDDDALTALAVGRKGSLWGVLAGAAGGTGLTAAVATWLETWVRRADRMPPHAFFAAVLGEGGPGTDGRSGRMRLLARLGLDAGDALDELLSLALADERRHPPSLTGFLDRLRRGGAIVKREAVAAGDAVRIMTVHGAKGLESPIVFLPDTTGLQPGKEGEPRLHWLGEPDDPDPLPAWTPKKKGFDPAPVGGARDRERRLDADEYRRLLYVALTRAEDRLIVCGWGKCQDDSWYAFVQAGFEALEGVVEAPLSLRGFPAGATARRLASPQTVSPESDREHLAAVAAVALPDWAHRPAPPEGADALRPSALPGEEETPVAAPHGAHDPRGTRFRRGRLVHALLQSLPEHPPELREDVGARFLARPTHGLDAAAQRDTLAEVLTLLALPELAPAFGPGSLAEAPIAGRIGTQAIVGQVDRLLIQADRILVLDYKTSRPPPAAVEDVPPPYLRQLAAYRAVLRQALPGRAVDCALIWTFGARAMPIPGALLDRHAPPAGAA